MIKVAYHNSVNVLQGLSWPDERAGALKPFDRAEWYQLLADAGHQPFIGIASDGEHSAALPLVEQNGRLEALRNWYAFTWRPFGVSDADLLEAIAADLKTESHRVILEPLPDEDGSATRLAAAFRAAGWKVAFEESDTNHFLDVAGRNFAEYWTGRPGRLRTTLKRKAKKVSTNVLTSFDDGAWEHYERIYNASWKPNEGDPAMLRSFAKQEGEAGRLRLGLAMLDETPIAAQFWTVENGIAYIHKLAHLEEHKALSAGTTLSAALFEHVIDQDKVSQVDFGTGDEPYKADWMEATRPRYQIDCINPGSPKGWIDLTKRAIRTLR